MHPINVYKSKLSPSINNQPEETKMCLESTINQDTKMDMSEVKEKMTKGQGYYHQNFTSYLATRLDDFLSPLEFHQQTYKAIQEMINNNSSNPNKPVPGAVAIYAQEVGGDLLLDIGIIAKIYCPANFADAVKKIEQQN
jgi:hypothetical protein